VRSSPPPVILSPEGAKNPIAPEALALSSSFSPRPPTPPPTPRELLTTAEAAELLRVDPQTLSTWCVTGHHHDLPFVKMGSGGTGGRGYYRRSDLEAFITKHVFRNTAQADVIPAKAAVIPAQAGIQPLSVLCEARDTYYEELR
jgi:hypothetical protein